MLEHGYIQIYTGDGKGKTTASLGLALRALGHGWKVLIIQFTKGDSATSYGEIVTSSKFLPNLEVVQFGMDRVCYSHNVCMDDFKEVETTRFMPKRTHESVEMLYDDWKRAVKSCMSY